MRCELGKSRRTDKERSREQTLSNENKKLKRELATLRKQIARLDLDRYSTIKDMVEEHHMEDKAEHTESLLESLKQQWKCRECTIGFLGIIMYTKMGNPWYFRKCSNLSCNNRTKSQKYTSEVRGLINEDMSKVQNI